MGKCDGEHTYKYNPYIRLYIYIKDTKNFSRFLFIFHLNATFGASTKSHTYGYEINIVSNYTYGWIIKKKSI